ncbi:MAG: TetR/AcrR family transcriptional regulator [Rhodospirillaceae bacterium]|nr:TetR/AcrR family transcriptional regulator [Rhodospirillaceae bacterium]
MAIGRPRDFDAEEALDRAMHVFWMKGYEGASLADLTRAMGINRPSLYAAFGNKEALFQRALERYARIPSSYVEAALAEPTARAVAEHILAGAIALQMDARTPRGCLFVTGAQAAAPKRARMAVAACRVAGEAALRRRLARAKADGDLPADSNPAALARFLAVVRYGMAVQSAGGATRKELEETAALAMKAWPTD